jgi:mannitol 2-dehydrogenase
LPDYSGDQHRKRDRMSGIESAVRLNTASLLTLQEDVRRPVYDRSALVQHTVHIGVGGFHRAHQAVYLDDLLTLDKEPRWGECGIGVLESDARMRDALVGQDCLYTVVEKSAQSQAARVIGSIADYIYAPENRERVLEKMAAEETRIVSLTITEGGYFIDEATRDFTPDHPQIQHDLQHPKEPITSFGCIAAALDRRRERGLQPFTLMSCDNLQGNGDVAKRVLLGFAHLKDPSLEQWIAEHMTFPNSMVDRITPGTTLEDRRALREDFGIEDAWPVMTEPFLQWVIEDHFCSGRPHWEKVGAELVDDVAPYELMKMRLLNGSHLAMAYLGALGGYTYVHEVMQDPGFISLIESFMNEVTPVVPKIPGVSVEDYKKVLIERFANPAIRDQITRICSEGSAKMPKWVLPSVAELLQKGLPTRLLGLVIASWIYYLKQGTNQRGEPLEIIDARGAELRERARIAGLDPRPMLAVTSIFGQQLPSNPAFVSEVERALDLLSKIGVAATMRRYLSSTGEPVL